MRGFLLEVRTGGDRRYVRRYCAQSTLEIGHERGRRFYPELLAIPIGRECIRPLEHVMVLLADKCDGPHTISHCVDVLGNLVVCWSRLWWILSAQQRAMPTTTRHAQRLDRGLAMLTLRFLAAQEVGNHELEREMLRRIESEHAVRLYFDPTQLEKSEVDDE